MSGSQRPKPALAGVVVLYHPGPEMIDNLRTYARELGRLFVVDNTPQPTPGLEEALSVLGDVEYIALGDNQGVAVALNKGAQAAKDAGFELLLTMDQDSQAGVGMLSELLACLAARPDAGLVAPVVASSYTRIGYFVSEVDIAITSGSIIRLDVWDEVGGFIDGLFIDEVDHEYCYRLAAFGHKVLMCHSAVLMHAIGEPEVHKFLGVFRVIATNHSAERRYYIRRNQAYAAYLYPERFSGASAPGVLGDKREFLKMVLFEGQRWAKISAILEAKKDAERFLLGRRDRLYEGREELAAIKAKLDERRRSGGSPREESNR